MPLPNNYLLLPISGSDKFPGIKRKALAFHLTCDDFVNLSLNSATLVGYFKDEVNEQGETIEIELTDQRREFPLQAKETFLVNSQTGQPTTADDPQAVGEYTYFKALIFNSVLSEKQLYEGIVAQADSRGKFSDN